MAPAATNLSIYQGDDYELFVSFVTGAGAAFPITGYTFAAQVRPVSADADGGAAPLATFVCTITDGPNGKLTISIPHSVTVGLPTANAARWDLQAADAGGKIRTYLAGTVLVTAEITRP